MRIFLAALAAFCLYAGASSAQDTITDGPRPYLAEVSNDSSTALSQGDPRWSAFRIGNGTVREQGCLVMGIAMVAVARGLVSDPLQLLRLFVSGGLFSRTGLLYTSSLERVLPGLRVLARNALAATGLDQVRRQLADGHDVLIKLDRSPRQRGIQQHWVRADISGTGELIIHDPNGGRTGTIQSIYGTNEVVREMLVLG